MRPPPEDTLPTAKSEAEIMRRLMLRTSYRADLRLFRNTTGQTVNEYGVPIRYGLGVGTSDLIGFRSVTITPEMVGETFAQFVAVEVKSANGRLSEPQRKFLELVRRFGGHAVLAFDELAAI